MKRGRTRVFGATAFAILGLASASTALTQTVSPSSDKSAPKAVEAEGYVFVSGQGPRRADGTIPGNFADQVRQAFENVKNALQSAGLTAENLVYLQVYLEDVQRIRELDEVFAGYFAKGPPARAVLGVAKVPEGPIQINAIAVRDLQGKQAVSVPGGKPNKAFSPGMLSHDQLFISTMPGRDAATGTVPQDPALQVNLALDGVKSVVQAAGLTMAHMVFVNPYLTAEIPMRVMNEQYAKRFEFGNTPGRATIEVSSLPDGTHIAYTGIAVRDLGRRLAIRPKNMPPSPTASPCVFAGAILYCSAKNGFIPGPNGGVYAASMADQTRQTMRNLLDNLEEAGMSFDQVVSTVIYLDDLGDTASFAKVYKKYFSDTLPAQTIVQQLPPGSRKADEEGHYPAWEQVSLVAVKGGGIGNRNK
jgi:enamine deaminase RidA (YjgF/YER057c/UK114 family)